VPNPRNAAATPLTRTVSARVGMGSDRVSDPEREEES
jgi:hypothetical protein